MSSKRRLNLPQASIKPEMNKLDPAVVSTACVRFWRRRCTLLEEFASRAAKLHSQLKNTILSLGAFLDAFQKIADAATNAR
ncbi:Hypothetical protein FKW44_008610, partial [Caligus rogercresseyi]